MEPVAYTCVKDTIMDQIAVNLLSLTPGAYIGYALLCWIIGGIAGAMLLSVKISFRRVSYLWFMAGTNLGVSISQFGWVMLPGALDGSYARLTFL